MPRWLGGHSLRFDWQGIDANGMTPRKTIHPMVSFDSDTQWISMGKKGIFFLLVEFKGTPSPKKDKRAPLGNWVKAIRGSHPPTVDACEIRSHREMKPWELTSNPGFLNGGAEFRPSTVWLPLRELGFIPDTVGLSLLSTVKLKLNSRKIVPQGKDGSTHNYCGWIYAILHLVVILRVHRGVLGPQQTIAP